MSSASASMRSPTVELLRRYAAVFRAAWAARAQLVAPRRSFDEVTFLPAALSLQDTPLHPAPRRAAWAVIALFAIALAWSIVGKVDIVAVAPGRIVVSDRTKLIQPLERSVVRRVLVRDGDHVAAGQTLIELDPTAAAADHAMVTQQLKASESEERRTHALLEALPPDDAQGRHRTKPIIKIPSTWTEREVGDANAQLSAEWTDIAARLAKLDAEIAHRDSEIATVKQMVVKLEMTVPLAQRREDDFAALAAKGFMSNHAGQDRMRERMELERDLATQQAHLTETRSAKTGSEGARSAYVAETRRSLRERESQAGLKRQLAVQETSKAEQRERLTTLMAPVAGTVQQLAVHTAGGVVTEAQSLMIIVPESASVTAEVTVENKDIGFVSAGQRAEVKLETFLYTRYGTIDATVDRVTADAVNDEKRGALFPATLTLARATIDVDGKLILLSPGMNVTAEIRTGKRRLIDYLLSPIRQKTGESFRER